jgi:hypothetical protein
MEEIFEKLDCQRAIQYLLQVVPSSEDWVRRKLETCYDDTWLNMHDRDRQWKTLAEISETVTGQEEWKKKFRETIEKREIK